LTTLVGGCGPCASESDNELEVLVDALVGAESGLSDEAGVALVGHGHRAIVILETGLYRADVPGRVRIARVLGKIGHSDAAPLLLHMAERDPSEEVRSEARGALEHLNVSRSGESN